MTEHPVVKGDLLEQIVALRGEVERKLLGNKYYLALRKLDELVEALKPLQGEPIEPPLRAERAARPAPGVAAGENGGPAPAPEGGAYAHDEDADLLADEEGPHTSPQPA